MLSRRKSLSAALTALVLSLQSAAQAQYYSGGCSSCGTAAPVAQYYGGDNCCGAVAAAPIAQCTPIQPVATTCYQTVPVTTYTQEKRTVEVPTYETEYEEREVTEYRPVTQSREVEVPTVSYRNVTEYRTVNRDLGRWVTNYHPVSKCTPCQVDPRPGVLGWLNRTGYSMRTAFMPNYTTSRQYVPNMVTCQVPVTRQVAVQGTQRVTVQETKMVAERTTRKVPVQKLVMRKEEVTVMRPQTAYRTVPIGTATAFSPFIGGTQMAFGYPVIESESATRSARLEPKADPKFSEKTFRSDEDDNDTYRRADGDKGTTGGASLQSEPEEESSLPPFSPQTRSRSAAPADTAPAVTKRQSAIETAATKPVTTRHSGWRASKRSSDRSISGSTAEKSTISMADSVREK